MGVLGAELTETETTVRVFLASGGLVVLGLALLLFTIRWWRGTRPEPPALAPLEVMGERRWKSAQRSERARLLDTFRPEGARATGGAVPEPVDLTVLASRTPPSFDDLRDPVDAAEVPPIDPEAAELAAAEETDAEETAAEETAAEETPAEETPDATTAMPSPDATTIAMTRPDETVAMTRPDETVAMTRPDETVPSGRHD
ncbi:MAG: hypothetical protein R2713_02045 [Ilumatobacteraceae bacterium]